MTTRILTDGDDVLLQCMKKIAVEINFWLLREAKPHRDPVMLEDLTEHWDVFDNLAADRRYAKHVPALQEYVHGCMLSENWCRTIEPFPEAPAAIARMRALGCRVVCVTSPMAGGFWAGERLQSLKTHFGIEKHDVVQTHSKDLVSGDFFIDDKPAHVRAWRAAHPNGVALLWGRPWNAKHTSDLTRITSWEQFFDVLQGHLT